MSVAQPNDEKKVRLHACLILLQHGCGMAREAQVDRDTGEVGHTPHQQRHKTNKGSKQALRTQISTFIEELSAKRSQGVEGMAL